MGCRCGTRATPTADAHPDNCRIPWVAKAESMESIEGVANASARIIPRAGRSVACPAVAFRVIIEGLPCCALVGGELRRAARAAVGGNAVRVRDIDPPRAVVLCADRRRALRPRAHVCV